MSLVRQWDGGNYDRISGPMEALGREVLARVELNGDELVLDAGCGSGRITEALIERLPRGSVIAVDASASMVDAARQRLSGWLADDTETQMAADGARDPAAGSLPRVDVRQVDLLELELEQPVDVVLSTATFHWISDHDLLFRRLHAALRPGGRLTAQCGGEGNISALRGKANVVVRRDPYVAHFTDWKPPWNYAGPVETRERLLRAGFQTADCWLKPAPTQPDEPRAFLSEIVLGPHVQRLPEDLRERFMDEVLEELGEPVVVDYIRLNIDASA